MAKRADLGERRDVFAAAALRVIMRSGVGGLTVREVSREAGFTTGALTHYFRSKDQLLIESSEFSARLMRPRMEKLARNASALEAIRKVVWEALPLTAKSRHLWRIWLGFWERSSYNPEVSRVMRARYDEWRGRLSMLIQRARSEGQVRADIDPDQAAQELVALVDGIGVQVVLGVGKIPAARQREIVDAWIASLAQSRSDSAPD